MKVLFIVPYPIEGQSSRFRVEQYLPYLREKGIIYKLRPFCTSYIYKVLFKKGYYLKKIIFGFLFIFKRIIDLLRAPSYDLIFIHREAYPFDDYILEVLFKILGRKMVFDFDDSIFIKKPRKTRKSIAISDCVIVGNTFLRDYVLQYNKNVVVLSTCIDTELYKPAYRKPSDKVVIGWIGTTFTGIYLDVLRDVYYELFRKYPFVEFRVIGATFEDKRLPLACKPWSLADEVSDIQQFDIGVMPLFNDDMARGKCAFKIIEYMAVGIPAVASKIGMNMDVIEDEKEGFLVTTKEEWIEKLSYLIKDKELRCRMGNYGRLKAEAIYSVTANKERFLEILKESCGI